MHPPASWIKLMQMNPDNQYKPEGAGTGPASKAQKYHCVVVECLHKVLITSVQFLETAFFGM